MKRVIKKAIVTITMSILMIPFFTIPVYAGENISESNSELVEIKEFHLDMEVTSDVDKVSEIITAN